MRATLAGPVLVGAIILSLPVSAGHGQAPVAGMTTVLARPVSRGEIVAADDFTTAPVDAAQARFGLAARQAIGLEAARDLPAGAVLHASDVISPRLVKRGEPVTISVLGPGYTIDSAGKALASGGAGDLVHVVSTATARTLDAVVDGPGRVRLVSQ